MVNKVLSGNLYYIEWNQNRQEEDLEAIERFAKGLKAIKKEKEKERGV
jgi:hypothetical protein